MARAERNHTGVDETLSVGGDVRLLRDGLLELNDSLVGRYCNLKLQLARALFVAQSALAAFARRATSTFDIDRDLGRGGGL